MTDALKDQVANRATVIKDSRTIEALQSVRRKLDPAVDNVLNRGSSGDYEVLRKLLNEVFSTYKWKKFLALSFLLYFFFVCKAAALFVPQFSEGDFSYKDVDSGAFNSAIDDLLNSIQRGDGGETERLQMWLISQNRFLAGIRDNAGRLGSQARALNDAGAQLKVNTKKQKKKLF